MAKRARSAAKTDLISTITDTIAAHPRLSAAVAFQMGVLMGQVMNNREGTLSALKRGMDAAPGALASALPSFGFFDSGTKSSPAPRRAKRKTTRRRRKRKAA